MKNSHFPTFLDRRNAGHHAISAENPRAKREPRNGSHDATRNASPLQEMLKPIFDENAMIGRACIRVERRKGKDFDRSLIQDAIRRAKRLINSLKLTVDQSGASARSPLAPFANCFSAFIGLARSPNQLLANERADQLSDRFWDVASPYFCQVRHPRRG